MDGTALEKLTTVETNTPAPAATAAAGSARTQLGQQDFLRMLVAQLEHQDPLNPQDPTQFTTQLAQFSSLEQLLSIRTGIEKLTAAGSGTDLISAAGLVGRQVSAQSAQFERAAGAAPSLAIDLDTASTSTRVDIVDSAGGTVRTLELGALSAGRHPLAWDGTAADGSALPDGVYGVRIDARAGGTAVTARSVVTAVVDGAAMSQGAPVLFLGRVPVPLADVEEVRASGRGA